jgi:beta-glucosidase
LQTGETRTATFELTAADLAFVNARNERVTEPGEFEVIVGKLRARFRYVE